MRIQSCMFFHIVVPFSGKPCKKMQKVPKINQKSAKTLQKLAFLCLLGRCTDFPDWFQTGSRLDFQKVVLEFAESGVKFWPEICRTG